MYCSDRFYITINTKTLTHLCCQLYYRSDDIITKSILMAKHKYFFSRSMYRAHTYLVVSDPDDNDVITMQ